MPPAILKLAIIGSGPSAFYAAARVLSSVPQARQGDVRVHMYDRLWAPHGLVRYGVAPDHPEVKNCIHKFHEIASDYRFRFFGNVDVEPPRSPSWPHRWTPDRPEIRPGSGTVERHRTVHPNPPHAIPIGLDHLFDHYTHLLIASGAPIPTLHPVLKPVKGRIIPALDMVNWYTGHPNSLASESTSSDSISSVIPSPLPSHVTVIGVGNVALDVARILLSDPSRLQSYNLPDHVMRSLKESKVKHVSIVGRRGPREASFTSKELRELMNLEGVAFTGVDPNVMHDALSEADGKKLDRPKKRLLDILNKGSGLKVGDEGVKRTWSLEFWKAPTGVTSAGKPLLDFPRGGTEPMQLTLTPNVVSPQSRGISTAGTSTLETSLIVTALGHHCIPETTPFCDPELGHIRTVGGSFTHPEVQMQNDTGRGAADATTAEKYSFSKTSTTSPLASPDAATELTEDHLTPQAPVYGQVIHPVTKQPLRNIYAAGWAARGAKGVLGTTMLDAHAVGEAIVADWLASSRDPSEEWSGPLSEIYQVTSRDRSTAYTFPSIPVIVYSGLSRCRGRTEGMYNAVTYSEWLMLEKMEARAQGKRLTWKDVNSFLLANYTSR